MHDVINESLDELMFQHNMECLYMEQNIVNEMFNLRYRSINESTNIEVIQEGVLETIKKGILTILRKIKELFDKIIGLFKGAKQKEQEQKIKQEIKTCEKNLSEEWKEDEQQNQTSKTSNGKISFEVYGRMAHCSLVYVVRGSKLFKLINACSIYCSKEKQKEDEVDIDTDKEIKDMLENKNDLVSDFYNLFAENCGHPTYSYNNETNDYNFPSDLKGKIDKDLDKKLTLTFKNVNELKSYIKIELVSINNFIKKYQAPLVEDLNESRNLISKLEQQISNNIKNVDSSTQSLKDLSKMLNILQTLINNTIPVQVRISTKDTRNIYHNLKIYNNIAKHYKITSVPDRVLQF